MGWLPETDGQDKGIADIPDIGAVSMSHGRSTGSVAELKKCTAEKIVVGPLCAQEASSLPERKIQHSPAPHDAGFGPNLWAICSRIMR